jgi:hypothetical protein
LVLIYSFSNLLSKSTTGFLTFIRREERDSKEREEEVEKRV